MIAAGWWVKLVRQSQHVSTSAIQSELFITRLLWQLGRQSVCVCVLWGRKTQKYVCWLTFILSATQMTGEASKSPAWCQRGRGAACKQRQDAADLMGPSGAEISGMEKKRFQHGGKCRRTKGNTTSCLQPSAIKQCLIGTDAYSGKHYCHNKLHVGAKSRTNSVSGSAPERMVSFANAGLVWSLALMHWKYAP